MVVGVDGLCLAGWMEMADEEKGHSKDQSCRCCTAV